EIVDEALVKRSQFLRGQCLKPVQQSFRAGKAEGFDVFLQCGNMAQWDARIRLLEVNLATSSQVNAVHSPNKKTPGFAAGRLSSVESEDSRVRLEGRILIATHLVCRTEMRSAREKDTRLIPHHQPDRCHVLATPMTPPPWD